MADIVNLRMARKRRDRAVSEAMAGNNRAAYGRALAEKDAAEIERIRLARLLDQAERER